MIAYYKKTLDDQEITVKHAIIGVTDNDKKKTCIWSQNVWGKKLYRF